MSYQIVKGCFGACILRDSDGAIIPADPLNHDWQAYQAWLMAGNAPPEPTTAGTGPAVKAAKT